MSYARTISAFALVLSLFAGVLAVSPAHASSDAPLVLSEQEPVHWDGRGLKPTMVLSEMDTVTWDGRGLKPTI